MTTPATPQHAPMRQFAVQDNQLLMGGMPLSRLAQRVGSTPFYAYDRHLMTDRVAELRGLMPPDLKIHYALKANPMPGSQLFMNMAKPNFIDHHDHFTNSTPESEWRTCLEHAEKVGVGTRKYKLIIVK